MDVAPPAEDPYCRQFHPNTFDPSRCGSCLRPDRMHLGDQSIAAAADQRDGSPQWVGRLYGLQFSGFGK